MKNKILIFSIIILPLLMYSVLSYLDSKTKNDLSVENIVYASPDYIDKVTIYKFYSPMCSDCIKQNQEIKKIDEKYSKVINEKYIENASKLAPCRVIGRADKPNPKVMGEYLQSINIKPQEAVMIGDRPLTDILAGKLLGCKTIWVGSINPNENLPTKFVRALERSTIRK